ncbi:hypothetical protein V8B97DRAFT_1539070 [Scleroderma yunnanense]
MSRPYRNDSFHFYDNPAVTYWILYMGRLSRTAALSLLIYERFLILEDEVDLLWCKRKRWVTFLYCLISWLGIVWITIRMIDPDKASSTATFVTIHCLSVWSDDNFSCTVHILGSDLITLVMTLSVQVILQLRVWAIYERSRKIMWSLTVLLLVELMAMVSLMAVTFTSLERLSIVTTPFGCAFDDLPPFTSLFWVPAIIVEPILCILVLRKALGLLHTHTGLPAVLARDSLVYFFAVFAELLSMLIAWLTNPLYLNFFFPWTVAFPSLFGCRLLLNIRKQFDSPRTSDEVEMETRNYV